MKKAISITITLLMLMSGMFVVVNESTGSEKTAGISSAPGNDVPLLTSHAPIRINSNADFANQAASEGWNGSGTQAYPYIIENYNISGAGAGSCVYIGNTTVYFVVRNCFLHDASGNSGTYFWNSGLVLYNIQNGIIRGNTVSSNNYEGIYLDFSSNNNIIGNDVSNNYYGIHLDSSSNNTITDNTVSSNNYYGIYLYSSDNNNIKDNTASNSWYGICLDSSGNNSITDNTVSSNIYDGIYIYSSDNINITGNTASNNGIGIGLYSSSNNNITGNNVSNNWNGIDLYSSGNNSITCNIVSSSNYLGIHIEHSSNNNIIVGNIASNNNYSIILDSSGNNNITGNNVSNNNYGIQIEYSSNNSIITGNTVSNNLYGIILHSSGNNNITGNIVSSNNYCGVYLNFSSKNNITGNNVSSNKWYSIYLEGSENNLIYHNNFITNTYQPYDDMSNNYWNASYPTGGNYWSDYIGTDSDGDGIGDTAYNISGGWAGDYYPLMHPVEVVVVDLIPPIITIASPPDGTILNTDTVTVSWAGIDASGIAHYYVKLDNGSWIDVGLNTSYRFENMMEGHHTVYVKAIDNTGNVKAISVTFTVELPKSKAPANEFPWLYLILLIIIIVVAIALLLKRKKSQGMPPESEESMESSEETAETPLEGAKTPEEIGKEEI